MPSMQAQAGGAPPTPAPAPAPTPQLTKSASECLDPPNAACYIGAPLTAHSGIDGIGYELESELDSTYARHA